MSRKEDKAEVYRAKVTEMDALVAYLQMLGTLVDFSVYEPEENYR